MTREAAEGFATGWITRGEIRDRINDTCRA